MALAQLDAGLAWWYRKYASEQPPGLLGDYESAETRAAADRVGLWQDANPMPPWEYRQAKRQQMKDMEPFMNKPEFRSSPY